MSRIDEKVDFKVLETELQNAIQEDFKYWRENSAKLRAVNQRVSSYDEFRDIVKAAHLKPLEKHGGGGIKQTGCIWNSLVHREKEHYVQIYKEPTQDSTVPNLNKATEHQNSMNTLQLLSGFVFLTQEEKFELLKKLGTRELDITEIEIPMGVLGNIVETLADVMESHEDNIHIVNVIEILANSKRFCLSLDFLTATEKKNFAELIKKLQILSDLPDQHHDRTLRAEVARMILNKTEQK